MSPRDLFVNLGCDACNSTPMVVVAKFDRLFRSVADAAQTIVDFDRMGIELVSIAEGYDTMNPEVRAMAQMAAPRLSRPAFSIS
jgi:DNA invertase Pin-like site-specific DNA recombinase